MSDNQPRWNEPTADLGTDQPVAPAEPGSATAPGTDPYRRPQERTNGGPADSPVNGPGNDPVGPEQLAPINEAVGSSSEPGYPHPGDSYPGGGYPPAGYPASPYPPGAYQGPYQVSVSQDDRNLAVATHLSPFLAAFVVISPLGPLLAYLFSSTKPFVRANAVEALNFNLTMWLGVMISFPLMFLGLGFLTIAFFGLMMLVFHIIAAVKAKDGEVYHYPMSIRFFG